MFKNIHWHGVYLTDYERTKYLLSCPVKCLHTTGLLPYAHHFQWGVRIAGSVDCITVVVKRTDLLVLVPSRMQFPWRTVQMLLLLLLTLLITFITTVYLTSRSSDWQSCFVFGSSWVKTSAQRPSILIENFLVSPKSIRAISRIEN
jgi:hypothetical protein